MTDFTTLKWQVNTGASDAAPTWSDELFGTAGNELRVCGAGAGAANTSSASWPSYLRPLAAGVIPEMWGFSADAVGLKITTYDGTGAHYNQHRVNWDALGTFASSPLISCWKDNTFPAATPGTQPGQPADGSAVVNGSADTGNASYAKGAMFGVGVTAAGAADNPSGNMGSNPLATSGSAGGLQTVAAAWSAWQSLQAATQWIVNGVIPKATTAGTWNGLLAWFTGPNQQGGTLLPVLGFQYTWV